mgnify:CR=1 FL=1
MAGIAELYRRLRVLMTFARTLRVDDSGALQLMTVQGFLGELRDDCARIGEWGLASNPPLSSQAVVLALGADRGQLVVIGVEDRATRRKNLPVGAVELYSAHGTARIRIDSAGVISIDGTQVNGTTGPIALNVTGAVTITASSTVTVNATGAATVNASAVSVNAAGAATVTAGGAATVSGASVSIGSNSVIDGKNFLAHTHTSAAAGSPTSGVI